MNEKKSKKLQSGETDDKPIAKQDCDNDKAQFFPGVADGAAALSLFAHAEGFHNIECTLILLHYIQLTGLLHILGVNISMVVNDISDQGINTKPKTK